MQKRHQDDLPNEADNEAAQIAVHGDGRRLRREQLMRSLSSAEQFVDYGSSTLWERCMTRGQRYRVIKAFVDCERDRHLPGEEWYFVGSYFNKFDDLMSIFVTDDGRRECRFDVCCRPPEAVCENFKDFIVAIQDKFREEYFATARCAECGETLNRSRPGYCPKCHAVWSPA